MPAHGVIRTTRAALVLVVLVALLATLIPLPAEAVSVRQHSTSRILADLSHQRIEVRLRDGRVARGDVLRFREDSERITLRPRAAEATMVGLSRMQLFADREAARGSLAGINGGYWLNRPSGVPNGLYVERGRVHAGDSANRSGGSIGRGVVGIQHGGRVVMDRLGVDLTLELRDVAGRPVRAVDEINRQVRTSRDGTAPVPGELLVYDDRYGTSIGLLERSTVLIVEDLPATTNQTVEGRVLEIRQPAAGSWIRVPPGRTLVLGYGTRQRDLAGVQVGQRVRLRTVVRPFASASDLWDSLAAAMPGGPLLIRDGRRQSVHAWREERFSEAHLTGRQPRTAIARRADGMVLLVTVDGRRPGWSVGMTLIELSETLLALGAVEALNLDGGGSTTMVRGNRIINRPSEVGRSVANGLFLYAPPPPPPRELTSACPPGAPTSGFRDTAGNVHAPAVDCLAWWGVTTGLSSTRFGPDRPVRRDQMASFIARWIDDIDARGQSAVSLPTSSRLRFRDVNADSPHATAIARLAAAGIIEGRSDTRFHPADPVTRAQTASLLRRALEAVRGQPLPPALDTFLDDNGSVHEQSIDVLTGVGVIAGVGGLDFRPDDPVLRGAMSSLLMRATDLLVEEERVAPPG